MPEPITAIVTGYVVANAPQWLGSAIVDKGAEKAVDKGQEWLSEAKQQRRLEQVLKKAVQRGKKKFQRKDRDQYIDILTNLLESGEHSIIMLREAMTLFTLSENPDLDELNEIYNRSLRIRTLSQAIPPAPVNAAPYLASFFEALSVELYADACFKSQISDVIRTRAMAEANTTLHEIHKTLKNEYTEEQFQQDLAKYIDHVEHALHNLKIVGFLPKEQKRDPEIHGIFEPLRIALRDHPTSNEQRSSSIVGLLEQHPHMVLLGDPGSGKSTAVRHLAWSHARTNQSGNDLTDVPLLAGSPLPLRIELRLLMQDRKHNPDYSFLSYATEVLLGRNHVHVNPLMFERLLQQKRMLVLFDGLDEVTTLDERKRLVEEIEHFVQRYPGNHILVTSRSVGYDLASCANHLFAHARVQNFDNDQIHQFLERWYTHVLGLSPLQYDDQQELETLFKTLKENQRLHKLAENPLLLTVITGLYRSQRLPEKRVQVYDRCAELLLETWAKLKGTDERWKDMKLGKEDQFACVAHLGFQLHKRSQEVSDAQKNGRPRTDTATDVSERVMRREIEHFISDQKLIAEVAEQRKEASRFLDLMRIEAGLIVERGTDENEESIYGFVHRTFQEYFAACDVYEHYQQEENPAIISNFLKEHLYDPHWSEVILLLLGKLKYKPLTNQLCQILNGTIKSDRSCYINIVRHDLFFVCECLAEDMPVETDLAREVIFCLSNLLVTTPFLSQRDQTVRTFATLMQTKQFASLIRKELVKIVVDDAVEDIDIKIEIANIFYLNSLPISEEQQQVIQFLRYLVQCSALSVEHTISAAQALYRSSPAASEERQIATQTLLHLTQHSNLAIEDRINAAGTLLHQSDLHKSDKQQVIQILLQFIQCADIAIEDRICAAEVFYRSDLGRSSKKRATQLFFQLMQDPDLSIEDKLEIIESHYGFEFTNSDIQRIIQLILQTMQDPDLAIKDRINAADILTYEFDLSKLNERQVRQFLLQTMQDPDLLMEDRISASEVLLQQSEISRSDRQQVRQFLLQLAQAPDLLMEDRISASEVLLQQSEISGSDRQQVRQFLLQLAQAPDLLMEDRIKATEALYHLSFQSSKEQQQAATLLWQLVRNETITTDQRLYIATIPIKKWNSSFKDKYQAIQLLQSLLSSQEVTSYLEKKWSMHRAEAQPDEIPYIIEIAQKSLSPSNVRDNMYSLLRSSVPQFHKIPASTDPSS